ncbi:MAG: Glyoxalase/bleomycin resistance protein/dioxygenase [Bacteroidetes bacterium]|nr:Glyoxalase/bleomycin resistance protein/dioxygenase [Bacteroidota bacterium]
MNVNIENVHLRVSNLNSSTTFYRDQLGLVETSAENGKIGFAPSKESQPVLFLSEDKHARRFPSLPGLYHVAYLYPHRRELAKAFKRLHERRWPFQGFADHSVSEALYLADPDGNGIELYADRPRTAWRYQDGQLAMSTERLDIENLLSELSGDSGRENGIHPQTRIGHIHLQVSDLFKAEEFYHGLVGFDVTQRNYPGALFVSAGGYHHHIGLNTWNSRGVIRREGEMLGLVRYGVEVQEKSVLEDLKQRLRRAGTIIETTDRSVVARDQDGIQVEFHSSQFI